MSELWHTLVSFALLFLMLVHARHFLWSFCIFFFPFFIFILQRVGLVEAEIALVVTLLQGQHLIPRSSFISSIRPLISNHWWKSKHRKRDKPNPFCNVCVCVCFCLDRQCNRCSWAWHIQIQVAMSNMKERERSCTLHTCTCLHPDNPSPFPFYRWQYVI